MEFEIAGRVQVARLWTGVGQLYTDGYWELALIVFFSSVLAPIALIFSLTAISGAMLRGYRFAWMPLVIKLIARLKTWSMMEIFLLAVGVSTIKLSQIADISFGPSLFAFIGLIFTSSQALVAFEPRVAWAYYDGDEAE